MPKRLLDLFCGAGGASVGYFNAGFNVVGVDIAAQPDYPFEFHQGDALEVLRRLLMEHAISFTYKDGAVEWLRLSDFDAIHASPPCQGYTLMNSGRHHEWPKLIDRTRTLLELADKPFVLENVVGAPLRKDIVLCGEMFGLSVIRHRVFELGGWSTGAPKHVRHRGRVAGMRHGEWFEGPYFAVYGDGGGKGTVEQWQQAMGIDWTDNRRSIAEAIPPAYTEWIGEALWEVA